MAGFDFEDMHYILSPLEVLDELSLGQEGIVKASIRQPETEEFSVVGYDFILNRELSGDLTETERLKVVTIAMGEASLDLTVALILPEDTKEDMDRLKDELRQREQERRQERRQWQQDMERDRLEHKKALVRLQIIEEAELTADAIELIKREVMVEHPDLHFPGTENQSENT